MPAFALPPLPSLPSLGTLSSLNSLSNLLDTGPSVFYPVKGAGTGSGTSTSTRTSTSGGTGQDQATPTSERARAERQDGEGRRARTISMPLSGALAYSTGRGIRDAVEEGTMRGRGTRVRGNSVTSNRTPASQHRPPSRGDHTRAEQRRSTGVVDEWRVVDNPLVRMNNQRRGSTASSASFTSSIALHLHKEHEEEEEDEEDIQRLTPRAHRYAGGLDLDTYPDRARARDMYILSPPKDVHAKTPQKQIQQHQRDSPTGFRPSHRRALSALPISASVRTASCIPALPRCSDGPANMVARAMPRRSRSVNADFPVNAPPALGGYMHNGTANGFAFPAVPPKQGAGASRLYDHARNMSASSLPTLTEGDQGIAHEDNHVDDNDGPSAMRTARRIPLPPVERNRRGSLSIALPYCRTRTYSKSSMTLSSSISAQGCSPSRPLELYRAYSNVSNVSSISMSTSSGSSESEGRRPMSPLSVCSVFGSSHTSEDETSDIHGCVQEPSRGIVAKRSGRQSFSVPPPAPPAVAFQYTGQTRPTLSPRGYSTGDVGKRPTSRGPDISGSRLRTRTHSSSSISSISDLVPAKAAVGAPQASDVAVMATWTFAVGHESRDAARRPENIRDRAMGHGGHPIREGVNGLRPSEEKKGLAPSLTLKERLASLSRLDTAIDRLHSEVDEGSLMESEPKAPGRTGDRIAETGWRMPLKQDSHNTDIHTSDHTSDRQALEPGPSIRVTSLANGIQHTRNHRPSHLTHRHTHSTPTLLHPGYISPQRCIGGLRIAPAQEEVRGAPSRAPIGSRKRQLSRLREPAPLGVSRDERATRAVGDAKEGKQPFAAVGVRRRLSLDEACTRAPGYCAEGLQGSIGAKAAEQGVHVSLEEQTPKKRRWWSRRNSISGAITPPVIRPSYLVRGGCESDEVLRKASASLSSLDLASPAEVEGRKGRAESPESEDFIDFDDM